MFVDLKPEHYRNDLDTVKNAYYAIPKNRFNDVFNTSLIENEFTRYIHAFKPSVLFSLDNEIGG